MSPSVRPARPRPSAGRVLATSLCALALATSGCASLHFSHAGRTAACAEALPAAFSAVQQHGSLVGFRVVNGPQLRALYLALTPVTQRHIRARRHAAFGPGQLITSTNRKACLAVFHGSYTAHDVRGAPPSDSGKYAVLVIFVRHATVVRARLVNTLPPLVKRLI